MEFARNGDVRLAYETVGDGEPVLLVMGIGAQMVAWPEGLCRELAGCGFAVTRFDHRDVGLSSSFPAEASYRLEDMADDTAAVVDAVGGAAHVVGLSMGGAIAQVLAVRHPEKVRSLTVMMSWTNFPTEVDLELLAALGKLFPETLEGTQDQLVHVMRLLGSTGYPVDEAWVREVAAVSWERSRDRSGLVRHDRAVRATGDLGGIVGGIRVPTLVISGEADPMFPPAVGRETSTLIHGARFLAYAGLGHDLPRELWPVFADEIAETARS